jgi:hypothetical protein
LDELDQKRNAGWDVYPLSLYSRADISLVKEFNEQYLEQKREQKIKEIMCPSVPLLTDVRDS